MIRSVPEGRFSRLAFERKGSVEIVDQDVLDEVRGCERAVDHLGLPLSSVTSFTSAGNVPLA